MESVLPLEVGVAYFSIVVMALIPIWIGAHRLVWGQIPI